MSRPRPFCACCIDVEHGLRLMRREGRADVWLCGSCRSDPLAELKQAACKDPNDRGMEGVGAGNKRTLAVGE